jgi:hypothetical protein
MVWAFFLGAAKVIMGEVVVLYTVLILSILRTEKTHYKLRIDLHDSARSALMLVIWLGLWTIPIILAPIRASLYVLEDTSADVGEWVLHHWNS